MKGGPVFWRGVWGRYYNFTMKMPDPRKLSLHARFVLGLGTVLLPFLLVAAVGLFHLLPRLTEPMEKIVEEIVEETESIRHLQIALLMAAMPVHDYLIGGDPAEQKQFVLSRRRVEQAFEKARAVPFGLEQERTAVQSAWEEWQQVQRLGEELLQFRSPVGNPAAAATMKRFDAHFHRAVALLDQVYDLAHREIDEELVAARAARTQSIWITFGAFALALAVSLVGGWLLSRYVVSAVNELRQGAKRLARGELTHRVTLARNDELGELAAAFDVMAERLEESQKKLRELAIHDSLTGLINHLEFLRRLEEEVERARRYRRPLALLMLDIDHFKNVNDTYGHLAGDEVLRTLAARLKAELRPADQAARYGGEEFAVILPETAVAGALELAERLRAAASASAIAPGQAVNLTVSIGVAAFPEDAETDKALLAAADGALYAAKQAGRNRVCRYTPPS